MSHNIDKLLKPTLTCTPKESTKVLGNAVIVGDDCKCHADDNERVELLTRQYQDMLAEAQAARDAANAEHDVWDSLIRNFPTFVETSNADIDAIFDGLDIE